MPIRVVCASCRCAFRVAEAAAGRKGKCPKCQTPLTIPDPSKPPAEPEIGLVPVEDDDAPYQLVEQARRPVLATARASGPGGREGGAPLLLTDDDLVTTATRTPAQILSAFREEIEPVRPTPLYRFWIVVVAGVMLVLPLIYLALIALVGWGVAYHATNHAGLLEGAGGGRRGQGAALAYFAPLLAGGFLIAFMIKPLFARSGKAGKTRSLDPSKEPLLFAFVDGVCATVGSRTPVRIDVDCEVNASARLEGGPFAIFDRRLVLTVGLPLVAGLDLKQFAGVLAHEFGHFSQGAGMRLSSMIYSINRWFARVVYERDAWDEHLESWSRGGDIRVMAVVWLFRGVVWLTRRALWVLMMIGQLISGFLSRQMEFDADRYEARMVGGEVFESTARRLRVLGLAMHNAFVDLAESLREGRLVDNLPKLVQANIGQIPGEVIAAIEDSVTRRETGLFDTHPCDKERIFRAHAEDTDGVFALEGPASDVFGDFDGLCRVATFEHYKSIFGKNNVDKESLRPVGQVVRATTATYEGNRALDRFYQGAFNPLRPLLLPEAEPQEPADPKAAEEALISARERMAATIEGYEAALKRSEELRVESIKVAAATAMLKADYKPKAAEFGLRKAKLESAAEAVREIAEEADRLDDTLSVRESATIRRIHGALSLLEADAVAGAVHDADSWREEARALYPVARHVGRAVIPSLVAAVRAQQALLGVLAKWQGDQQNPKIHNAVRRAATALAEALGELNRKLGGSVAYPFDHAEGAISLARYALPTVPAADDVGALLEAAANAFDKTFPLHHRLVGRLALAAEEVEKALGLLPLPERPKAREAGA